MKNQILDLEMQSNDALALTIREYFKSLLIRLWEDGEGFSAKRPFGNSGWDWDLYIPLIKAGLVDGVLDQDGYIEEVDEQAAFELILSAIRSF